MSSHSSGGGWEERMMGSLLGIAGVIFIALLLLGIYLAIKATNQVIRAFLIDAGCKPLYFFLGVFLLSAILTYLVPDNRYSWACLGISTFALLTCARAVELGADPFFQARPDAGLALHDIVNPQHWWHADVAA